jgi:hypothetical protein
VERELKEHRMEACATVNLLIGPILFPSPPMRERVRVRGK